PMLPITHGVDYTHLQIFLYTVILSVVSLLPFATYMSGVLYLTGAMVLDALFLYHVMRMHRDPTDRWAIKTFTFSIVYLAGLFLLLLVDRVATFYAFL
ncbi:MAG: heme o synthase, partial [Gammaproteobacteria bacterium]